MSDHDWPPGEPPDELGVLVHGPAVLARTVDITVGLRCVFAHPAGLHLPVAYRATGSRIHDTARWSYGHLRRYSGFDDPDRGTRYSAPQLHATLDGRTGTVHAARTLNAHSGGVWGSDATYWIEAQPHDGRLILTLAWPDAGLTATTTTLDLEGLHDLTGRVLPLLTWPATEPLRTERLALEPLHPDHLDDLHLLLNDPRLHVFTGETPPTRGQLRARIARQVLGRSPDARAGWLNWVLRRHDDGQLVGTVQATLTRHDPPPVNDPRETAGRSGGMAAELTWVTGYDHQRRGFATEAARTVADWLTALGVDTLNAHIRPGHDASAAIARHLGLHPTGHLLDGETWWTSHHGETATELPPRPPAGRT